MFNSFKTEKPPELCKHKKNAAECQLCKLSMEDARMEADIIKGGAIHDTSAMPGLKSKYGSSSNQEKFMESTVANAANPRFREIKNDAEDELTHHLELGEFVSSVEMQIHRLQECLKEIKKDPMAFNEYTRGNQESQEKLKKLGIEWNDDYGNDRSRVLDKIEKSKETK